MLQSSSVPPIVRRKYRTFIVSLYFLQDVFHGTIMFFTVFKKWFRALFPPSGLGSGVCASCFRAGGAAWMGADTGAVALLANMQLKTAAIILVSGLCRFALRNATFRRAKRHISPCETRRFALQNGAFCNSLTARPLAKTAFADALNIKMLTADRGGKPEHSAQKTCGHTRRDKRKAPPQNHEKRPLIQ